MVLFGITPAELLVLGVVGAAVLGEGPSFQIKAASQHDVVSHVKTSNGTQGQKTCPGSRDRLGF